MGSEAEPVAAKSTREHLVDVGVRLMHQNGYNATGLSDILKAADVPKGSFYHHFESKEDFAVAALEEYGRRVGEHSVAVLNDTATPPLARLRRYFNELIKLAGQTGPIPGCMVGRFSLEVAESNPQLRERLGDAFGNWRQPVAVVIRQAVEQKELAGDTDADALADFVLNSWEGALLRSQADKSDEPLELFMRYVFDGLFTSKQI